MPTLADLAHGLILLTGADVEWLHALVSDWQLLADLSFADLVLWAPLRTGSGWVALAQMRPTTGPTALYDDMVGTVVAAGERPLVDAARAEQRICREGDPEWTATLERFARKEQRRFDRFLRATATLSALTLGH